MEKTIAINEAQINVQFVLFQQFTETKPVLVFLHEALGSAIQWKSFPLQVCESLNLPGVIIERSGHGKSSPLQEERTRNYLHAYAGETELVLLELFSTQQPILLVGHSDGGSIALILAKSQKINLVGIVTMAAHTFVEPETIAGIAPAIEAFESGKLDGLYRIHGEKTKELFYAWSTIWTNPDFASWDIRPEIKEIKQPILAIQGKQDQYGTPAQVESITIGFETRTGHILPACGHHPHLEKTMETIQLIHNWYQTNFH